MDSSAPSILPPWVRVPSTPSTLFSIYIVQIVYLSFELECEKNENKQKEAGIGPFLKKNVLSIERTTSQTPNYEPLADLRESFVFWKLLPVISVTRLGDLLHFQLLFIACGNN